jgi:hypothetical protein
MAAAPTTEKVTLVHVPTGVAYQFWGPDAKDAQATGEYVAPDAYVAPVPEPTEPTEPAKGKAK